MRRTCTGLVRGWEKLLSGLASLFCLSLPGSLAMFCIPSVHLKHMFDSPEEVVERGGGLLAPHQVVEGGVPHHPLHDVGVVGVSPPTKEVVHLPAPPLSE